jgi:hypothetical protein
MPKGLKKSLSMTNYCQHLARGLTLLKQFWPDRDAIAG